MPICPFATQKPLSGAVGPFTGGPFKIVHHTTEGSSADGAMAAFLAHRSDPHFTVDGTTIYQHIDTAKAARALRNPPGGVETNTDSAVQIELVGFAGKLKNKAALRNVARLCRWIEANHAVPRVCRTERRSRRSTGGTLAATIAMRRPGRARAATMAIPTSRRTCIGIRPIPRWKRASCWPRNLTVKGP
jgi:hypothetical protein